MFHFLRDPAADGVGVAFTSAALDLSDAAGPDDFARLSAALGVPVAVVRQVHGNSVLEVSSQPDADAAVGRLDTGVPADALICGRRGLALAVRVADCVPVVFADVEAGLVGAAHAGRAGLVNGVLAATISALRERGAKALRAWIGPHICGACYEVAAGLSEEFADATGVAPVVTRWGTPGIDLGAAARLQLSGAGVRPESHEACTLCDQGLHSYRRDGARAGRGVGVVWRV